MAFLGLTALAQPSIAYWAERSFAEMSVFGLPVFYVYLGGVYFSLIGSPLDPLGEGLGRGELDRRDWAGIRLHLGHDRLGFPC